MSPRRTIAPVGVRVRDVMVAAAQAEGLSPADLFGPSIARRFSAPRQRGWFVAANVCPHASPAAIARICGDRDPTTVRHGISRVKARLARGDNFEAAAVADLTDLFTRPPGDRHGPKA